MQHDNPQIIWDIYKRNELARVTPILADLGYTLDQKQPHIEGERFLMSGKKLVLIGTRVHDGLKCVIKTSSIPSGMEEIEHEHRCRETLGTLDFAYHSFFTPREIMHIRQNRVLISITEYLVEEQGFLTFPLAEQFFIVLKALQTQEGVHATTSAHTQKIRNTFGIMHAEDYVRSFMSLVNLVNGYMPSDSVLLALLHQAEISIRQGSENIARYCGFLTHGDFVPHNFKVLQHVIYLLDNSSLHFGNKYESWARLVNFMVLHNPALATALCEYIRINRSKEEYAALRLMRIYKLAVLISFYAKTVAETTNDLQQLALSRIEFWSTVLKAVIEDRPVDERVIESYKKIRDALRSSDEKERQQILQQF